jgi:hypothetical protein
VAELNLLETSLAGVAAGDTRSGSVKRAAAAVGEGSPRPTTSPRRPAAPEAVSGHQNSGMPDAAAKAFQELTVEFDPGTRHHRLAGNLNDTLAV